MTAFPMDYTGASSLLKTATSVTLCDPTLKGQEHRTFVNTLLLWDDMQLSTCTFLLQKRYTNSLGCEMGKKSGFTKPVDPQIKLLF